MKMHTRSIPTVCSFYHKPLFSPFLLSLSLFLFISPLFSYQPSHFSLFLFLSPLHPSPPPSPALSFHRPLSPQCSWLLLSSGCQHSPYPSFSHSVCLNQSPSFCLNFMFARIFFFLSSLLCLYCTTTPQLLSRLLIVTMVVSSNIIFPVSTHTPHPQNSACNSTCVCSGVYDISWMVVVVMGGWEVCQLLMIFKLQKLKL